MHKNIIYIIGMAVALAACSSEDSITGDGTLSGNGKTPLPIHATLSTGSSVTRAAGETFAEGDELLTYIRHVTGGTKGSYTTTTADQAPRLVTLTKGSEGMTVKDGAPDETTDLTATYTNTSSTTTTGLYWDDFSSSVSADKDLRTDGHGLQSYYGYCYNGGTPSTTLTKETGVLGWTVETDQSTAAAVQHSDLLWSAEQEKVSYNHSDARTGTRPGLSIPYTHAMSEVTVDVVAGIGFEGSPLTSTTLTLKDMYKTATMTAPAGTYVTDNTETDIIMYADENYTTGLTRTYTAIIAPDTKIQEGKTLLKLANIDDNDYTLTITGIEDGKMLHSDNWGKEHTVEGTAGGKYILTKPGVNYHLTVTVNKTTIEVEAKLTNWTPVNATGTGVIGYPSVDFDMSALSAFSNGTSIQVFKLLKGDDTDDESERTNEKYSSPATVSTYDGTKWTNSPILYWLNQTDEFYFRAMSQANDNVQADNGETHTGGIDVLWGTTPAHGTFAEGDALGARINEVPLAFIHAMSKVTFKLETDGTDGSDILATNAKVNLASANISISNLYVGSGTIKLEDGSIEPSGVKTTDNAITGTATVTNASAKPASTTTDIAELKVLPQTIGDESVITITLPNQSDAVYKLQLNKCVVAGGSTPITAWESNKNYVYTIRITKEEIQFRALVKDWENTTGSGDANLEWD